MIKRKNVYLLCLLVTVAMVTTPAAAVNYTWIGATSGSADWDNAGNWDPCGVPDGTGDVVDACDVLTGNRGISTPSSTTGVGNFTWTALGSYEDRLTLNGDFSCYSADQNGWYNTSRDTSKMTLDLNGNTFTTNGYWWMVPDMTIEGPGTFKFATPAGIEFAIKYTADPCFWTSPVFESTVTVEGMGPLRTHVGTIPNLTTIGDLELASPGITIEGDFNVNDQVVFASGTHVIEGDITVVGSDPSAGFYTWSGVGAGLYLKGNITDTNTEQNGLYNASKLRFVGGGNVQTLDIRRQSDMRLVIDPCSHVLLGSDYYAPYGGTITHVSSVGQAGILDVANYDLTLTDLSAQWDGDVGECPTFKYIAGTDSGSITVVGDDANAPSDTGLRLTQFNVEITDGGGWTGGDDFILFDYDKQGSGVTLNPTLASITLPTGWTYTALVHDTSGKRIYLSGLDLDTDGDGVIDSLDACPGSDANFPVDVNGCLDTDDDGVADVNDLCPDTCPGASVDSDGCPTSTEFCLQLTGITANAWGDYNNDDYADMIGPADVYTNNGDGTFTKTTPLSGLSGVSLGDWNNDGYLDVFSMYGSPQVWTNNGDETWTNDSSLFASASDPANCSGSTWGDWNGDGWLDTYSTGWYTETSADDDVIYMSNDGLGWNQTWTAPTRHGKGVMACDYDEDGDMDIYVSNYWLDNGFLWQNNDFDGNSAGLTDVRASKGLQDGPGHTQGSTWADFDNDGDFDLFICNFAHTFNPDSRFMRNNGASQWNFTNLGLAGVTQIEPISSSTTGDIDNDGYLDLVITTSEGYSPPDSIFLYTNDGDFTFTDATSSYGLSNLGPDDAAAFGDYNNDGWLDLIVGDTLYRNAGGSNHWLKIRLIGGDHTSGFVNKAALGAQVRIESYTGLGTLTRQVQGNTGAYGMQNDQVLHFGLGPDPCATYDIDIDWPNGYSETVQDVNIDEYIIITISAGDTDPPTPNPATFSSAPSADSESAISMTATTGTDATGPVEYFFNETSGNPGGTDSGWQTSTSYTNSSLTPSTQYTYTVQMRDSASTPNVGTASSGSSATTDADTSAPTPNPATFSSPPAADSDTAISMTATTGSDATGPVEYYFDETSDNSGGSDSGWQTSASYTDTDLTASTQYTYTVQMRDSVTPTPNTGTASSPANATTDAAGCTSSTMHIEAASCAEVNCGQGRKNGQTTITIYDNCGDPVENALVDGTFSGDYSESFTDVSTNASGQAVFTTTGCIRNPTWTFTVDDVTDTLTYNPNDDLTTGCGM